MLMSENGKADYSFYTRLKNLTKIAQLNFIINYLCIAVRIFYYVIVLIGLL